VAYFSNTDFHKKFGNEIVVYPFNGEKIMTASIDLSVDKDGWGWDLRTKKLLMRTNDALIVPPHSSAVIMTEEIIYVEKGICGTYHAMVGKAMEGFSNISTTLDPGYMGTSFICIHNYTSMQKELKFGSSFMTLMLAPVSSECVPDMHTKKTIAGRIADFENGKKYIGKLENAGCYNSKNQLRKKMLEDENFKSWKRSFSDILNPVEGAIAVNVAKAKKWTTIILGGVYLLLVTLLVIISWGIHSADGFAFLIPLVSTIPALLIVAWKPISRWLNEKLLKKSETVENEE
jgi:deoxycytidine triphosphate deaminase